MRHESVHARASFRRALIRTVFLEALQLFLQIDPIRMVNQIRKLLQLSRQVLFPKPAGRGRTAPVASDHADRDVAELLTDLHREIKTDRREHADVLRIRLAPDALVRMVLIIDHAFIADLRDFVKADKVLRAA